MASTPGKTRRVKRPRRPTPAAIYARFSPRPDAEECESCEVQIAACRQYAEKQGYVLVGEPFCDQAVSGKDGIDERPGLFAALQATPRGGVLIVHYFDRLARDYMIQQMAIERAKGKGVRIEAVNGDCNGDEPTKVLIRGILALVAQFERAEKAARTSVYMRQHQARGRMMSHPNTTPYGYVCDPDDLAQWKEARAEAKAKGQKPPSMQVRLVPAIEEQEVIQLIHEYANEGHGVRAIATRLEEDGFHARNGKKFNPSTI